MSQEDTQSQQEDAFLGPVIDLKSEENIIQQVPEYTANILPCRIKHSGHIKDDFASAKKYWNIESEGADAGAGAGQGQGQVCTYFRGRKLNGMNLSLELKGYKGFVISNQGQDQGQDQVQYEPIATFNTINDFHNGTTNANNINFTQLIDEWLDVSCILND